MAKTDKTLTLSNAEATEEARIVVENILRYHPNPFHITPKKAFYAKVDKLLNRDGEVSIAQQFFSLGRIASLIFDTHTQIHVTNETPGFDSTFPLRFRIFPDGLYIIAGSEAYRKAIGKKVISISGQEPDKVLDKLSEYAYSDHIPRKRVFAEIFLYMPETYDVFDLKTKKGNVELVLQDLKGEQSVLALSETWPKGYADFSWDRLNPFIPKEFLTVHDVFGTPVPIYQKYVDDNYWFQFLDDDKQCMYIQLNKQFDKEGQHPIEFHMDWTKALWESNAELVIVDMRNDPGGMTYVGFGLPSFLETFDYVRENMKGVAVLMGLDTVSAGTMLIAELEKAVRPVLIGEPTGSSPNMYLAAHKMALPYSKLQLEVSREIYISAFESDPRAYIAPDIPMALTFEDYANGRDPLLERAKQIDKDLIEELYEGANHLAPWKRKSQQMRYNKGASISTFLTLEV